MRLLSPELQDAVPGHILSLSFLVTNRTDREEEFLENLQLPAGWQALIPARSFRLRASEATTRLVAFQVPQGAAAGRYEITYGVRSQRDYVIQDADTATIAVLPVTKLALLVEEKPEKVIAGDRFEAKLRLVNQGNSELQVALEVRSQERYPAKLEPTEVTLAAGHSIPILVTVQTDAEEHRPRTLVVEVKARAEEINNEQATAGITVGVEIIPRVTGELDIYHRLPAQLRVRLSGEDGRAGVQAELSGRGTLDEAGTRAVDFLLRAPDTQSRGTYGWRDEYHLNYYTDDLDVRLGDQSYGLSRLTSYYRYGRGLGVDVHQPDSATRFGAYYLQGRWDGPGREEGGLYVSHQVSDNAQAQVNFLREQQDAFGTRPAVSDTLWSVETRLQPTPDMNVQAEYGRSDSNRDGGVSDDAYRVEGDGRLGQRGYWRLSHIHAGPDYHGYYRDSDYTHGSVTFAVAPRTRAQLSYGRWASNLELRGAGDSTANREKLWQVSVSQSLPDNWNLSLGYDDFSRYDALLPANFDFRERAWQLGIGRSQRDYSLRLDLRMGDQEDRLTEQSQRAYNWRLFGTYRPRRDATFTLYGGFGDDRALRGSRLLRTSSNLGASVAWRPTDNLDLDLWYSKYNFDSNDRPESDQFSLRVGYALPNDHSIEATARHSQNELWDDRTSYLLAYSIPLSLPVSRRTSVGAVKGQVYDAAAPGRPGIAGVILRINAATAVTDTHGRFVFPSVAPGTYQIYVDRASIGLDRVTEQELPLNLEATGGEVTQVELGLVRAAKVSGRVLVIPVNGNGNGNTTTNGNGAFVVGEPGNNNARHQATGLANVLVELANGQEVLRRVTDHRGRFLFDALRPGEWHLKVYDHNLPAYHYLETPEQDLTLEPGQTAEVTIRVLPKVRQIRFIDEGVITPEGF